MRHMMTALILAGGLMALPAVGQETRVGVLTDGITDTWNNVRALCGEAATEGGAVLDFRMPSPATIEQQNAIAEKMVQDGVKALAVCPIDPQAQAGQLKALAAKLPLILLERDAPDSGRACFIGTDHREAGRLMGEVTKEALPPMIRVLLFTSGEASAAETARLEGLKASLEKGQYFILEVIEDKGDRGIAGARAVEALKKHPEVGGYFGTMPYHAGVLLGAVRAEKRERMVSVIAYGNTPEGRDGLATGGVFAVVRPDLPDLSKKLYGALSALSKGETPPDLPENRCYSAGLLVEKTEKPRNLEDIADALQIPRVLEETTVVPRPSFE
ncbi:MAG: substrate-binding domain-containing protein [Candidatus Hydrogenedentes bacterium]|nr:substrate-binding domain-containing protein [Candidatus Hydrogenedentota bacterium]